MDIRFELPEINTWRVFNKGIDQAAVIQMVEAWEAHGYRFGSVSIDDGWTIDGKLGDWIPDPQRFPDFKGLVEEIHRKGYAVRLWIAPTQIHSGTKIFERAFPDNLLKDKSGKPAFYSGLGTFRLDPRSELGQQHIRQTMQRLVREYSIDAFKVDFPPFYEPRDEFYEQAGYDFSDHDDATMIPEFHRLIRESLDAVNPAVRVQGARDLPGCEPYVNDVFCGDLVGQERTLEVLSGIVQRLNKYAEGWQMTPWLEMIWGEGSQNPSRQVEWYAGFLEFIALSINFGMKLEHSFLPFDYPNHSQIRTLTNLYGPRNTSYKVLCAGRREYSVADLLQAGIDLGPQTRFLVAPEEDTTATLQTAMLRTNAIGWRCRDVLENCSVAMRARNEFWGRSLSGCKVVFEAKRHHVYELWYEGEEDAYFADLYRQHVETAAVVEEGVSGL